jgi:hypothetical protein
MGPVETRNRFCRAAPLGRIAAAHNDRVRGRFEVGRRGFEFSCHLDGVTDVLVERPSNFSVNEVLLGNGFDVLSPPVGPFAPVAFGER